MSPSAADRTVRFLVPARRVGAVAAMVTVLLCVLLPHAALAAPTDPDPTYGTDGRTVTSFGEASTEATASIHLADGRLVVAGSDFGTSNPIKVARHAPDGKLEGTNEHTYVAGGKAHAAAGVAWTHAGTTRLMIAGGHERSLSTKDFALLALEEDGTRDAGFGDGGSLVTPSDDGVHATI